MHSDDAIIAALDTAVANAPKKGRAKFNSVRCTKYLLGDTIIKSYNCPDQMFRKGELPTMARGLFVIDNPRDARSVLVRGYDKFFNIGELESTTLPHLTANTSGPYEITVKENGCIIFLSAFHGRLVVTSKHALHAPLASTGQYPVPNVENKPSHAQKGDEWVDFHLKSRNKSRDELARFLESNNVTAVFELADDAFEQHILEYPEGTRGLYLHGVNKNACVLETWDSARVREVAEEFGFWCVESEVMDSFEDVMKLADECRSTGSYKDRPVEGFVVRCISKLTGNCFMFKIKYDEPYLMFREWREITTSLLDGHTPNPKYRLSETYASWCQQKLITHPSLFSEFKQFKGIIAIRNLFLQELEIREFQHLVDASSQIIVPDKPRMRDDARLIEFPADVLNLPVGASLAGSDKIIFLPIAIVGLGKSTLAAALMTQFHDVYHHVQSDAHSKKPGFLKAVMVALEKKKAVFVDRNNHLEMHRVEVSRMVKERYPGARVVAIEWDVKGWEGVVDLSVARIERR
ncbi:hypothetical protein HDU98_005160 [Podochytrium sp. JEL0797]|nr:hypothetical protein HDU98_005160 [Podochytrium sp. JEL0797]